MEYRDMAMEEKAKADVYRNEVSRMSVYELIQLKTSLYQQIELEGIHYELNRIRSDYNKTDSKFSVAFEQRWFADLWLVAIDDELQRRKLSAINVSPLNFAVSEENKQD